MMTRCHPTIVDESSSGHHHAIQVERKPVGALVTIRGESRGRVVQLTDTEPYLRFVVGHIKDNPPERVAEVVQKAHELRVIIGDLMELSAKLPGQETPCGLRSSLEWVEEANMDCLLEGGDLDGSDIFQVAAVRA